MSSVSLGQGVGVGWGEWATMRCLKPLETSLLSQGREMWAPVKETKGI